MLSRHQCRKKALNFLYVFDLLDHDVDILLQKFSYPESSISSEPFLEHVLLGTCRNIVNIDKLIIRFLLNWDLNRLNLIDKCILRIAVFELFFNQNQDVPHVVVITEALQLAKCFSGIQSIKFINGILDKMRRDKKMVAQLLEKSSHQSG